MDEPEAEAFLRQAYQVAGLEPSKTITWLDSPLQLVRLPTVVLEVRRKVEAEARLRVRDQVLREVWEEAQVEVWSQVWEQVSRLVDAKARLEVWEQQARLWEPVEAEVRRQVYDLVEAQDQARFLGQVWGQVCTQVERQVVDQVWTQVRRQAEAQVLDWVLHEVLPVVQAQVKAQVWPWTRRRVEARLQAQVEAWVQAQVEDRFWSEVRGLVFESVCAYREALGLAVYRFFDEYLAPNDLHALARFNEMVSGYRLEKEVAVIVRRPRVLSRDAQGRLHNATGKCVEYRDGWGFHAWHGVHVPEKVILQPEALTREDFLSERNVEVRRVMQERMGQRFVSELGGIVLDTGPRGTLYEVALPDDDPERVARYVQVQDASKERQYVLRVPPTTQTAAEAVAWGFGLAGEDYHPAQET